MNITDCDRINEDGTKSEHVTEDIYLKMNIIT